MIDVSVKDYMLRGIGILILLALAMSLIVEFGVK